MDVQPKVASPVDDRGLPFLDLKDSPIFQKRVDELVRSHESSVAQTQVIVEAAKHYGHALDGAFHASIRFIDSIESFSRHDSNARDGPMLARFAQSMRELSTFVELLRTQVELIVCNGLGEWAKRDHQRIQERIKNAKLRRNEYDATRGRHLHKAGDGLKELVVMKREASDEARLALARELVESRERLPIEVMRSIASVMQAQKKYFEHGYAVGEGVEPHVDDCLKYAEELDQELQRRLSRFHEMVGHEMKGRDEVAQAPVPGELEALIQQSFRSNNRTVTILKQGFLLKRSSKRNKWDRRYFVLDSSGILYYYSSKAPDGGKMDASERKTGTPQTTVNLVTAAVKPGLDVGQNPGEKQIPFTFRIVSPEREYCLQAEDEDEAMAWMEVLQSVILCLLSGAYQASDPECYMRETTHFQRNVSPVKPTHSRDASQDLSRVMATMDLEGAGADLHQLQTSIKHACADCGGMPADWASINLVARLCIECSGIHRKLGVHVSKVRSCSLDTKVWDDAMLSLFSRLGNDVINGVWEARVQESADQKPVSGSSTVAKEAFVTKKYVDKAFLARQAADTRRDQAAVSENLWIAIEEQDIVRVYEALCILEQRPTSPQSRAMALAASVVGEAAQGHGEAGESCFWEKNGEQRTDKEVFLPSCLHLAAWRGDRDVLLLLLLSGKFDVDGVDASGKGALMYALWFDNVEAAKLLLKHGAQAHTPDFVGLMPLQLLRARGERALKCNSDPQLLESLM